MLISILEGLNPLDEEHPSEPLGLASSVHDASRCTRITFHMGTSTTTIKPSPTILYTLTNINRIPIPHVAYYLHRSEAHAIRLLCYYRAVNICKKFN